MQNKRILIPVKLLGGSFDALLFAQRMAAEVPVEATLLHVVNLNVATPEGRVYDEVCAESEKLLRNIAKLFFSDSPSIRVSVRVGRPHEAIVAEAQAERCELIILSGPKASRWKGLFGIGTVERVARHAPCPTLVLPCVWKVTPEEYLQAGRRQSGSPAAAAWQPTVIQKEA